MQPWEVGASQAVKVSCGQLHTQRQNRTYVKTRKTEVGVRRPVLSRRKAGSRATGCSRWLTSQRTCEVTMGSIECTRWAETEFSFVVSYILKRLSIPGPSMHRGSARGELKAASDFWGMLLGKDQHSTEEPSVINVCVLWCVLVCMCAENQYVQVKGWITVVCFLSAYLIILSLKS